MLRCLCRQHLRWVGLCLLSLLLLNACGYRLRGHTYRDFHHRIPALQLASSHPYGQFERSLLSEIAQYQIKVLPSEWPRSRLPATTWILSVSDPKFTERTLSYSSDGQTNYLSLEMILDFEAQTIDGQCKIPKHVIQLSRPMSIQPNAFLNNDNQRVLLKKTLYQEAAVQILHQLATQAHAETLLDPGS